MLVMYVMCESEQLFCCHSGDNIWYLETSTEFCIFVGVRARVKLNLAMRRARHCDTCQLPCEDNRQSNYCCSTRLVAGPEDEGCSVDVILDRE